jgi:hypothetical protein
MLYAELPVHTIERGGEKGGKNPAEFPLLIGAADGLYGLSFQGDFEKIWAGGAVKKIIRAKNYWAFLTDKGIVFSDGTHFETRNSGLPVKIIKIFENGKKSFATEVQGIKDFEISGELMTVAFKDAVYLSQDAGKSWKNLGAPAKTDGVKAVAVVSTPELTVFVSHSIYGISYITPNKKDAAWIELNAGIEKLETTDNPDEVSDIAVFPAKNAGENPAVYISQTFRRKIYKLDWNRKRFDLFYADTSHSSKENFGTIDSLSVEENTLRFVRDNAIMEFLFKENKEKNTANPRSDILDFIKKVPENFGIIPNCVFIKNGMNKGEKMEFSELWLVNDYRNTRMEKAYGKSGLYLPVNQAVSRADLDKHLALIKQRGLDMIVIDMKDDFGRLRFTPKNPKIAEKGRVFNPVDLDVFLKTMKELRIYAVARIVVFKDPELAKKENGKYAVWDAWNNRAWQGYYDRKEKKGDSYETVRTPIDEQWVDPYSEEVWDYNADIAKELQDRGFDEIQFDYIRFPTDGDNLGAARYRWRDAGMDKDSAILSFLNHVRARISAPISIDIYGANGWYRTGARTGQEVELLAPYIDVICPMYYPSHFEQTFLAQPPAELRPYRIYFLGTGRTAAIARKQVVVRPWAQAFYLNVSYDRQYYNEDYVRRQIEGVNDAGAPGYTYWNNSGRYDDIPFLKK